MAVADVKDSNTSASTSEVVVGPKQTILQCDFCDQAFTHKRLKMMHMHVHHCRSDGNYRCSRCGALVKEKAWNAHWARELKKSLFQGLKLTAVPISYPCPRENCDKRFTRAQALRGHINEHDDIKPYLCQFCGIRYCRKSSLKKHISASHQNL